MLSIYEIATSDRQSYLVKQLGRPQAGHLTNQSLHSLLDQYRDQHQNILVLLDEKHFVMAHSHHEIWSEKNYTAQELHDICLGVSRQLRQQHTIGGQQLYYHIDNILINGQPKDYLIGSRGQLSRDITCIYLKYDMIPMIEQHWDRVSVIPESLATIQHIKCKLRKKTFSVLWIHDDYLKAIHIQDHQYIGSNTINRGKKKLMEMIIENGVGDYFLHENIDINPIAEKLLTEAFSFYCEMIAQWMNQDARQGTDVIMISDLIKHKLFMQVFQQKYHADIQGYIVPLHIPPHQDKYLTVPDILFTIAYTDYLQKHLIPVW